MDSLLFLTLGVAVGASGVGMVVFLRQRWGQQTVATAEETAKLILEEAKKRRRSHQERSPDSSERYSLAGQG